MASTIHVANETKSSFTRNTKDGRQLTYELSVLQQPQRARACGSGAKSSADRRPVDPPPVVELKVLEGKEKTDITFKHNANFFLFTTLESARQIAPVRGQSSQAPVPVLTGMPVAGMAYLDRPQQAGYFIFPDLSVRHEGKYRLSFNLFEELKETKDMDIEPPPTDIDHAKIMGGAPMAANSHVHFRLEVKSEPFVVYSAKKFPGLSESTSLSRVVAEQGCRVRIRRDVRMRRRETKASEKYEEEDFTGEAQNYRDNRFQTPDAYGSHSVVERSRSVSNTSVDGNAHYPPTERRTSTHEPTSYYQQPQYQQAPPAPVPQPSSTNYQSHLTFGQTSTPQYQAPQQPTASYTSAPTYPQYQQTGPHQRQMSNGSNYNYNAPQAYAQPQPQPSQQPPQPQQPQQPQQQQQQQQPQYQPQPSYQEPNYHRPTTSGQSSSYNAPRYNDYPAVDTRFSNHTYYSSPTTANDPRSVTPSNTAQQLPPLKMMSQPPPAIDRKYEQSATSMMSIPPAASSPQPVYDTYGAYASVPQPPLPQTGKRSYGKVFDQTHLIAPVQQGSRPEGSGLDNVQIDSEGQVIDEEEFLKTLTYRRADGSQQRKKIPSPV